MHLIVVCTASQPYVEVGRIDELGTTEDGVLWHDHCANGWSGDIVCTGPFMLHRADSSLSPSAAPINARAREPLSEAHDDPLGAFRAFFPVEPE